MSLSLNNIEVRLFEGYLHSCLSPLPYCEEMFKSIFIISSCQENKNDLNKTARPHCLLKCGWYAWFLWSAEWSKSSRTRWCSQSWAHYFVAPLVKKKIWAYVHINYRLCKSNNSIMKQSSFWLSLLCQHRCLDVVRLSAYTFRSSLSHSSISSTERQRLGRQKILYVFHKISRGIDSYGNASVW